MHHRTALVALVSMLSLAACGGDMPGSGTPDISKVRSCLAKAGLKAEDFAKEDKKVSEGVFATGGLQGGDAGGEQAGAGAAKEFTFAVAAVVRDEKTVAEFERDTKEFSETLAVGERKLVIDSGSSGRYVWVVGGVRDAPAYDDARTCVKD